MRKLVECVPNFSEGRHAEIIDAIVYEMQNIPDVFLFDKEMDAAHNRSVITVVGEPNATKEAVFRMIKKAAELIDLNAHTGEHPRMGATDVVPFIPLENMTTDECVELAKELGQRVGKELNIPVYLYEDAATRPERKNLANVRKGQFEGLREEIGKNPDRDPDYGPNKIHPTAGATAIGARFFLVAYNVNLDTQDVTLAKNIAKKIRESSGGFPCVKAMGFELTDRKITQVSMNLVNYKVTSIAAVFNAIKAEADQAGVPVLESEIVGLVPCDALNDATTELLQLKHFDHDQIIENKLARIIEECSSLEGFLSSVASASPAPGGGSASALAGSLAGALTTMVCHLTVGKKKYQHVAAELTAVREQAEQLQRRLYELIDEDSEAYKDVVLAYKLPGNTAEEVAARENAIQTTLKNAAKKPLEVMQKALEVLKLVEIVSEKGNPNAITDAGCAGYLAQAAIKGACLNVKINLGSITDPKFITQTHTEIARIQQAADESTAKVVKMVESKMT